MPKARSANFTLKTIDSGLTAERCTNRLLALQKSGQYSELRLIKQSPKTFMIKGYKWPSKTARRKYGVGKANPSPGNITANQVQFGQHGKTKVGWINRETPTRYEITYKDGPHTKTVWRKKNRIKFMAKTNPCPKSANPKPSQALEAALKISERFHHFKPRAIKKLYVTWPKAVAKLGNCARIDYITDKFDGKIRQYYHEFENPEDVEVHFAPDVQPDGDSMIIIKGKFKVDSNGID